MLTGLMGWWPSGPSHHADTPKTSAVKKSPGVAMWQINTEEKVLQQRCDEGRTCTVKRKRRRLLTSIRRFQVCRGKLLQRGISRNRPIPRGGSALKWGLREVQPGSTPYSHTAELPSPVLLGLTGSFLQVLNQCFRLGLNSSHTCPKLASGMDTMLSQSSPIPPLLHRAVSGLPSPSLRGLVLWLHFQLHVLLPPTQ